MTRAKDILGMNARNLLFIQACNRKVALELADSKLSSKKILLKAHLPVPKIYKEFNDKREAIEFDWQKNLPNSFVLKPNRGYGGEGILVVFGKRKEGFVKPNGEVISVEDIRNHTFDILDGNYSLNQIPDHAFIEQKLKVHPKLKKYVYRGIPDIRIVVYNNIPVMAMMRLPTRESEGRANLHQGAIGVGIDIATGITTIATYKGQRITKVPGTKYKLNGIKIPEWDRILNIASETQRITKIGYLGVDIVLDREIGPTILEINARPGLSIQIANQDGLKKRLERVAGLEVDSPEKAVRIAKEIFGGKLEKDTKLIEGKKVIGIIERVKIIGPNKQELEIDAKIDTGAWRSGIDKSLLKYLGKPKILEAKKVRSALGKDERKIIELKFLIRNKLIKTAVYLSDRTDLRWKMLIGRRDLHQFLVDPAKNASMDELPSTHEDKKIEEADSFGHLERQGQE